MKEKSEKTTVFKYTQLVTEVAINSSNCSFSKKAERATLGWGFFCVVKNRLAGSQQGS